MDFQFGAAGGRYDLNPEMERIWNDFCAWARTLPFNFLARRFRAYANSVDGAAGADYLIQGHPEYRGDEIGRIAVDVARFQALNVLKRNLTLLHESCHLGSFTGDMRCTYETKLAVIVAHGVAVGAPAALDDFGRSKSVLARGLADQLLEHHAETILANDYPNYAEDRAQYLLEMRRESVAAQHWTGFRECLKPYRLLLESLRIELGETLTANQRTLDELRNLRRPIDAEIRRYPDASDRVTRIRAMLQPVALGVGFEANANRTYEAVVDDVMSVQQ